MAEISRNTRIDPCSKNLRGTASLIPVEKKTLFKHDHFWTWPPVSAFEIFAPFFPTDVASKFSRHFFPQMSRTLHFGRDVMEAADLDIDIEELLAILSPKDIQLLVQI
jgi:hypothetical protein